VREIKGKTKSTNAYGPKADIMKMATNDRKWPPAHKHTHTKAHIYICIHIERSTWDSIARS